MAAAQLPSERIEKMFRVLQYIASLLGVNITNKNFTLTWQSYSIISIIVIFHVSFIYSVYDSLSGAEADWGSVLRATSAFTVAIKVNIFRSSSFIFINCTSLRHLWNFLAQLPTVQNYILYLKKSVKFIKSTKRLTRDIRSIWITLCTWAKKCYTIYWRCTLLC